MESNTKFGLALIVLLVGTLAVVVYKKMDRRRAEGAVAAKASSDPDGNARRDGTSPFDRAPSQASAQPGAHSEDERDDQGFVRSLPAQSEPPLSDEPQSQSTAYRGPVTADTARSTVEDDGYNGHPLRRVDSSPGTAAEPNPFPPATAQASGSTSGSAAATTNPFADPAATAGGEAADIAHSETATQTDLDAADAGSASLAEADAVEAPATSSAATTGGSPFDESANGTAGTAETAGDDDVVEAPWSPASQAQLEAGASTSVSSDPGTATAVPVSHDAPWGSSGSASASHAVGSASDSPPFSPVQAQYDSRPQGTAPAPEAAPAEASPWDAVPSQTSASGSGAGSPSDPFDSDTHQNPDAPSRTAEQQQLDSDLSTFGAEQSLVGADDRPEVYTVRPGDTYWDISRQQYGSGRYYRALALYNSHRIPDPRRMRQGMKVLVPTRQILESRFASVLPQSRASATRLPSGLFHEDGEVRYRVGRGDTLGAIAHRHLGRATRWPEIFRLNQTRLKNPATLKVGMELRLPADASRVRVVSEAGERR